MAEYNGWTLSHDSDIEILKDCPDAKSFFNSYVVKRKPVVIKTIPNDLQEMCNWSNEFLMRHAGTCMLDIEERSNNKDTFGKGRTVKMSFGDFLQKIEHGNDRFYLTSQEREIDTATSLPNIVAPPLTKLFDKLPHVPELLGNLLPANINMWMGNAPEGSTTGLHFDYHDNLYIVLRGQKRFRLFSPADALHLYTVGEVTRIHPNGRINLNNFETAADGSEPGAEKSLLLQIQKLKAEAEIQAAKCDAEKKISGGVERLRTAEEAMDRLMESMIDAADDFENTFEDDYEESESDYESSDSENAQCNKDRKRRKLEAEENDPTQAPLNFSRVDNLENPSKKFVNYRKATSKFVHLHEGDVLFLPAGWFHEVTSTTDAKTTGRGHFAVNFWMHPSDTDDFEHPYSTNTWALEKKLRELGSTN